MPNSGFSWGAKLSDIADAVWTRSERKLTNLNDARASKIDNLDVAVSSRATSADVWEYPTRGITEPVQNVGVIASDLERAFADTERSTSSTSYVKLKEFRVYASGTIRVKWQQKVSDATKNCFTRVFRNGVAVSGEFKHNYVSYQSHSYDIGVMEGDYIQLYCKVDDS